jgi:hypothetical protein
MKILSRKIEFVHFLTVLKKLTFKKYINFLITMLFIKDNRYYFSKEGLEV